VSRFTLVQRTLIVAPVALAACLVARYGVDVPFWDEWTIAEFLQKIDGGTLTASALLSQHNEHRMLVPRIIQLAVAFGMGWDTRILMWLSLGLLLACLSGCVVLWRRSLEHRATWPSTISLALVALLVFSPAQHQNLLWGFQICFFVPGACLLASTIIVSSPKATLGLSLAAASVLSTAATFSILPGLLTWPLTAWTALPRFGPPSRTGTVKWVLWAVWCSVVIALYFFRYEPPVHSPSLLAALNQPITLLTGTIVCVGSPFSFGSYPLRSAFVAGVFATGALGWLMLSVWRRRTDTELVARATPWMVIASFGFLSGAAIAVGRVGYGYVALLESRYASLTMAVYIGVMMLAAVLRDRAATARASREWVVVSAALAVLYALSFPYHLARIQQGYSVRLQSQAIYIFAEAATSGWPMIPPWLDWPATKQKLLSVESAGWRHRGPASLTWVDTDELRSSCAFGSVEFVSAVGTYRMAGGWGFLPTANRVADAVLVTVGPGRRIAVVQPPLIGRRDIGERLHSDSALVSGWLVGTRALPAGELLAFWALDIKARCAYRLCWKTGHQSTD
jgi:hypothetical protein